MQCGTRTEISNSHPQHRMSINLPGWPFVSLGVKYVSSQAHLQIQEFFLSNRRKPCIRRSPARVDMVASPFVRK